MFENMKGQNGWCLREGGCGRGGTRQGFRGRVGHLWGHAWEQGQQMVLGGTIAYLGLSEVGPRTGQCVSPLPVVP